jgi:Ca2+-binding RTX toxin-like protein
MSTRLRLETCEVRLAPAVIEVRPDPALPGKRSLFIEGTADDESILVRPRGTATTAYDITVNSDPAVVGTGVTGRIYVTASGGADLIRTGAAPIPVVLDGGAGDDTLTAGAANDSLTGGPGNDVLNGGAGIDRLVESADGDFTLVGGTTARDGSLTGLGADVLVRNRIETALLTGGPGANRLDASAFAGRTTLLGGDGPDELRAGGLAGVLVGGPGDDTLLGAGGRDILIGGAGTDRLSGGDRDDLLVGGATAFDSDPKALNAIRAEWSSAALYGPRIKHLSGTLAGGLNGSTVLTAATVSDDGAAADTLTGGANWEWFFRDTGDVLPDLLMGLEVVTDV